MAGMDALLRDLEEEATCMVCQDIFTDPRLLPCLHTLCLACLKKWYQRTQITSNQHQGKIVCPTCRNLSDVPVSGDLEDLPTSSYESSLVDVLAIKQRSKSEVTCGNCEGKSYISEASYCFQCCIFYCVECVTAHRRMRKYRRHRALAVRDFQDKDYENILKRPSFCPKQQHRNKELKYFCKNCKKVLCQTCSSLEHSGHDLKLIVEEVGQAKDEIETLVKTQQNTIRWIDEECANVIEHGEDVKANVESFAKRLTLAIEAKKEQVFAAVEEETKKSLESLTAKRSELEQDAKAAELSLEKANKLLARSMNAELIQLKITLEAKAMSKNVERQIEPGALRHDDILSLAFEKNEKLQKNVDDEPIGRLTSTQTKARLSIAEGQGLKEGFAGHEAQFIVTTRNLQSKQCYNECDVVTIEIRKRGQLCPTVKVQKSDCRNGQYKISYFPVTQGRYSVIVKINGEPIRDSPFTVIVKASERVKSPTTRGNPSALASPYSSPSQGACSHASYGTTFQFRPLFSFGAEGLSRGNFRRPCGVAVSDADEIAVTEQLNHRVQIFDSSGKFLRSFGRRGIGYGEFKCPYGICFDSSRNVFVADRDNNRIQIFNEAGTYKGIFDCEERGRRDSHLNNPCGLSMDGNSNVIVADSGNKRIKIFSNAGKFVKMIGGPGSFNYPVHCVQCNSHFVVSDQSEHRIKVFDLTGKFQFQFGGRGKRDGELSYPSYLSVTKAGYLLVCDAGNHRVQVFDSRGNFITKFGTFGSELGEFNEPQSVAVLGNGNLVVSDWWNHRIQLFQ